MLEGLKLGISILAGIAGFFLFVWGLSHDNTPMFIVGTVLFARFIIATCIEGAR